MMSVRQQNVWFSVRRHRCLEVLLDPLRQLIFHCCRLTINFHKFFFHHRSPFFLILKFKKKYVYIYIFTS